MSNVVPSHNCAAINLTPYQGLKQHENRLHSYDTCYAAINLTPYQGLKRSNALADQPATQ